MTEKEPEKAKRAKVKSEFVVLWLRDAVLPEYTRCWGEEDTFRSSAECMAAIKARGTDGVVYQVAMLRGDPVRVEVKPVETRTLVPYKPAKKE